MRLPHCVLFLEGGCFYDFLLSFSIQKLYYVHAKLLQLCSTFFAILWTVAHQAFLFKEFFRQEYSSGLLFPPPGGLSNRGTELTSLMSHELAGGFFTNSLD